MTSKSDIYIPMFLSALHTIMVIVDIKQKVEFSAVDVFLAIAMLVLSLYCSKWYDEERVKKGETDENL